MAGCFSLLNGLKINVDVNDAEMGYVEGVSKSYRKNYFAKITAVPRKGYVFSHWSGDVPEEKQNYNPLEIEVTANLRIVANFTSGDGVIDGSNLSLTEIYKDYFPIGGAVAVASWASKKTLDTHQDLIKKHLSSLTAENAMKPDYLQPREGVFNFREADRMVDFAKANGMKVRGHTLVWHGQTPEWFFRTEDGILVYEDVFEGGKRVDRNFKEELITNEFRELVQQRMENHIEEVMTHFGDDIYAWDVVNEAVSDDWTVTHRHDSPWYRIFGDDFMKIAFEKAHEVNPNAKLFYNDYNAEMVYKRSRIRDMLKSLIDDGVPIHGMGIQAHWGVNGPDISEIEDALKMYAELGIEIHITEMDVSIKDLRKEQLPNWQELQAERYSDIFRLFKKYSHVITNVTLWGIADDATWLGEDAKPFLFDENQNPKPSFWAVVDPDKPWYENMAEYTKIVD